MTDARIAADRVPDTYDDGSARAAVARVPAPEKVVVERAPRNPWLLALVIGWVAALALAVLCLMVAVTVGTPNEQTGAGGDDVAAAVYRGIANLLFGLGFALLVVWVAVKAILWRAPEPPAS